MKIFATQFWGEVPAFWGGGQGSKERTWLVATETSFQLLITV